MSDKTKVRLRPTDINRLALDSAVGAIEDAADAWDAPLDIQGIEDSDEQDVADEAWRKRLRYLAGRLNTRGVR